MFFRISRLFAVFTLSIFSVNAVAQTCGPVELLTDEAGAWDGTVGALAGAGAGLPEQDLLGLTIAQSEANGEMLLTFRILTAGTGAALPPNAAWFTSFETPDGVLYGVRLQTDPTGAESFFSYIPGAANGGQTDGRFIATGSEKPAEAGSEFGADGVVTIIVKASNIGVEGPGQTVGPFNAASLQSVPQGVLAFTVDEAPVGLGRDGFFDTQASCGGKSGSGLALGGGLGFGLLLPLALLGLRRLVRTAPLALTLGLFVLPANAATPDAGTISASAPELSYTFPMAPLANASGLTSQVPGESLNYTCDAANPCDEFALTIDLPADYLEQFPDAAIKVAAATSNQDLDIDLQITNAAGEVVYLQRDNPPAQPTIILFPVGGVEKFTVQVAHGTPHTGGNVTITLQPGDEVAKFAQLFAGAFGGFSLLPLALLVLARRVR